MAKRVRYTEAELEVDNFEDQRQYAQHVVEYWYLANEVEHRKMMRQTIHKIYDANPRDPSGLLDGYTVMADNDLYQACCNMGWDWQGHWEKL